jgi:B12-binding domain/radical SAM domain protein of rhizo-twelve system
MRFSLINPSWNFDSSIYFGCREPHLPLEFGYSKILLERAGHEAEIIDGQLDCLTHDEIRERVAAFQPDFTVITTAPSYLFWRCAPPELRVPKQVADSVRDVSKTIVAVGPHASTTPHATLRKLGADVAIMGECEEILPRLVGDWRGLNSICVGEDIHGGTHSSDMSALPALHWPDSTVRKHAHHHHRFDAPPEGPGAEMETSRGCPYHCTFCERQFPECIPQTAVESG